MPRGGRMCHFGSRIITLWLKLRSRVITRVVTITGNPRRTAVQFNTTRFMICTNNLPSPIVLSLSRLLSFSRPRRNPPRGRSNSQLWHEYFLFPFFPLYETKEQIMTEDLRRQLWACDRIDQADLYLCRVYLKNNISKAV